MDDIVSTSSLEGLVRRELASAGRDITQVRGLVADAVANLSTGFERIASEAKAQQSLLEGLLAKVDEDGHADGMVAKFVVQSEQLVGDVSGSLDNASQRTLKLAGRLDEIDSTFRRLARLSDGVLHVSEQIRVLAFNANLEAARAGESGRGFAVVAMAVRELSQSFRSLTVEIRDAIGEARESISGTVTEAREAAAADQSVAQRSRNEMAQLHGATDALNQEVTRTLSDARQMGDAIHTGVGQCIKGLQFDDLIGQICQASQQRIAACSALSASSEGTAPHPHLSASSASEAQEHLALLAAAQHSAVQQTSLDAGDVEFF